MGREGGTRKKDGRREGKMAKVENGYGGRESWTGEKKRRESYKEIREKGRKVEGREGKGMEGEGTEGEKEKA